MEQTLSTLQSVQGQSVDELERQLEEAKEIKSHMKRNERGRVLQNLITILLNADEDGDMMFSDENINELIERLEGLHAVDINDEEIRKVIVENGRSVEAVMKLARAAFETDETADDTIFKFLTTEE